MQPAPIKNIGVCSAKILPKANAQVNRAMNQMDKINSYQMCTLQWDFIYFEPRVLRRLNVVFLAAFVDGYEQIGHITMTHLPIIII